MKHELIGTGYDPTLNRHQPEPMKKVLVVLALAVAAVAAALIVGGVSAMTAANGSEPVPTRMLLPTNTATHTPTSSPTIAASPTSSPTVDSWGMTGTALARFTPSPTFTDAPPINYCGWRTPTATPLPTLEFTPDAWGLAGTATYEASHPSATPWGLPRELCDNLPQWTPTFTPYPLPSLNDGSETPTPEWTPLTLPPDYSSLTQQASALNTPAADSPAPDSSAGAGPQIEYRDREVPVEVIVTQIVDREVQVQVPVYVTMPPIIITATPLPTVSPTSPVIWLTLVPTYTPTSSPTPTATATSTATPTSTPTSTSTLTETPTPTPTETVMP